MSNEESCDYAEVMCGVCGVVQIGGEPREVVTPERLDLMTDAMTHRGPNDRGTHQQPGVALGVRRLSIVDVAGGHQPVLNESGTVVGIQNGELYNHAELREQLRTQGHRLSSRCDTEILPHLYERDGEFFPNVLRGKFAAAVWDEDRRRGVLARDRLGVKPLYWAQVGDVVVFASELKCLLASGVVDTELDLEAVDLYLNLGYVPGPRTLLNGVRKLAPGGILVIADGAVRELRYWTYPTPEPKRTGRSLGDSADELLELLRAAVADRLMSDVPLGAMLSGGLDSSLVVALMAERASRPVETFAVGFREDPANELADARRVAHLLGCEHHELELSVTRDALSLDELVWHLDEPVADLSTLGFDLLSKLAAEHVTVALSGQGADELFGGYPKHRAAATIGDLGFVPGPARRGLARIPWPSAKVRRATSALAAADPSQRLIALSGRLDAATRESLYGDSLAQLGGDVVYETIEAARGGANGDPLGITLYLDAQLALIDHMLLYFDKCSMAHSLEVRVPYLDHRLVEWAAAVPSPLKVRRGVTKRVLKAVGARYLPESTVEKKKVGFLRYAVHGWLEAQLAGDAGASLLEPDAAFTEVLDPRGVHALVDRYRRDPTEDSGRLVLAILMLNSWLESFVRRATHPAAHT